MKVSELAKQLGTTSQMVLITLKSLKLKAKDADQELSSMAASVVKSELSKNKLLKKEAPTVKVEEKKEVPVKKTVQPETKKEVSKEDKTVKVSKTAKEKDESKESKVAVKKIPAKTPKKESVPVSKEVKVEEKPKVAVQEISRPKIKLSKEPVITLKPLTRKKKRPGMDARPGMSDSAGFPETASSSVSSMEPLGSSSSVKIVSQENLPEYAIDVPISVKDFSSKTQQKPSLVLKELMKMGVLAHINQNLDGEIVQKLAEILGFRLSKVKTQEEKLVEEHEVVHEDPKLLKPRSPVVTFMGHVDHGKTSLLDRIRKSKVADSEHGGITQHIGAYSVQLPKGRITFLDTPGHEAFTAMRARGAHITDLIVLVVAADEGIMPQTKEAIDHARAADVPIIVALNKIDKKTADLDKVKKQLMTIDLTPEDWGGKTVCVGVSAQTGAGVENLLEMILLEAELLELRANPDKKASGIVVEAHLSQGRGVVTTVIVQAGTIKEGDVVVVGPYYGKAKAMFDDLNRPLKEAGPSMPMEFLGLPSVPEAGERFYVVADERTARNITAQRQEEIKTRKLQAYQKITLEDLYSQIQKGAIKELNVIMKADVQGSLEALKDSLERIPNDKIKLKFIHMAVGDVNLSDVLLAVASGAIIIAFHVNVEARAKKELELHPVDIREYRIIYDAVNDIRNALEGMLEAKTRKKPISRIEIRQVMKLSKAGIVAGCYVQKGRVSRKATVDILRNHEVVYSGKISSLKRFKDDVREVNEGMECGITVDGFDKFEQGDIIEAFELEMIAQKL